MIYKNNIILIFIYIIYNIYNMSITLYIYHLYTYIFNKFKIQKWYKFKFWCYNNLLFL